jgi:alkylation response protein AidB-like acyl-CoA dehydrogenase
MDLQPGPEQEAIRDAVRTLLAERLPPERVRAVMAADPCVDDDVWRAAAGLGWFGLHLPEAAGGSGFGVAEAMLLFVELGRALAPGPWIGTALAARALADSPAHAARLRDVVAGECRVALVDDPTDALGTGAALRGRANAVLDAGVAHALLVVGATRVVLVPADARGVRVASAPCMDPTRRIATVDLDAPAAAVLDADAAVLRRVGTVLAAAEAVGVAERALEASVAYAKVREQFGKPIGTFQAIKHRCADMATRTEAARAATTWAAVALDEGADDVDFHVHVAKALAGTAALVNAHDNVQNHGGMGYTWESDAHLYLKRARVLEHVFGSRTAHLDAIAAPWRAAS